MPSDGALSHRSRHFFGQCWRAGTRLMSNYTVHTLCARVLTVIICLVFILVPPVAKLGGQYVFLALSLKELVFPIQHSFAEQLEVTILNCLGALTGVGLSSLAIYLRGISQRHQPSDSAVSRLLPALFLGFISYMAGYVRSRLPRLQLSARISCFISIWLLVGDYANTSVSLEYVHQFLWLTAVSSSASLFATLIFLRATVYPYVRSIIESMALCRTILGLKAGNLPKQDRHSEMSREDCQASLLRHSDELSSIYARAVFETRVSRFNVKSIKPFISIIEHLRRDLVRGSSYFLSHSLERPDDVPQELGSLGPPANDLLECILRSMDLVHDALIFAFELNVERVVHEPLLPLLKSATTKLSATVVTLEALLQEESNKFTSGLHVIPDHQSLPTEENERRRRFHQLALDIINILDIANELQAGLRVCIVLVESFPYTTRRVWLPKISLAWLGIPTGRTIAEFAEGVSSGIAINRRQMDMSWWEVQAGLAESGVRPPLGHRLQHSLFHDPLEIVLALWDHPSILRLRLRLSRVSKSIKHSPHIRHALKNCLGVMLLSLPAYLPASAPGRRWFIETHGQWMVISYVWVLEPTTGATWRVGCLRLAGTVAGAIYSYIAWLIVHENPYGLFFMVLLAELPISWLILRTPFSSMGTVAAVTLPPIILASYVDQIGTSVGKLAILRSMTIAIGIIAALLVNHVIFPRHSRVIFLKQTSDIFEQLTHLYLSLCRYMMARAQPSVASYELQNMVKLELRIRSALVLRSAMLVESMESELSLNPKPVRLYRQVVVSQHTLLDTLTGLRSIRERIPKREAVENVLKQRRDFISCISVSLLACEYAFGLRKRLPQFLPSARQTLGDLTLAIENSIRQRYEVDPDGLGYARMFAFAEGEAMEQLVSEMENLLNMCRQLFGVSSWIDSTAVQPRFSRHFHSNSEIDDMWFSIADDIESRPETGP